MPAPDTAERLAVLRRDLAGVAEVLDPDRLRAELAELEAAASEPGLWDDQARAQEVTSRMSAVRGDLSRLETLAERLDDAEAALELDDADLVAEAEAGLPRLEADLRALEVRTLLSGEFDEREALVTVQSQAGGVDAADFAEMLLRMYLRWAERRGYATEVYDTSYAEEAGIKSATFAVRAPYAYGTLAGEHGVHRLVRISPFDNQGRRQTSFAGVDVVPVVESNEEVDIPEAEMRVDVFRSSGPGGQSVNTTDSAVRLTHLPTGIVVSCQNEKSQIQNRAAALKVLQARLLERRRQEEAAAMDALRGDVTTSWGNQIRNYVLHPYQMVKDLRTEVEVGNPQSVLDGDLDGFLESEIRWARSQATAGSA